MKGEDRKARIKVEKRFGLKEGQAVLCKTCKNIITLPAHNITVNGEYIHEFTNPEGVTYRISCFSSASGCMVHGIPVMDHTWFEGFSWSISLCSNCFTHLGWYYKSDDQSFFGLIVDRLLTNPALSLLDILD
jgi:hypothetical protein